MSTTHELVPGINTGSGQGHLKALEAAAKALRELAEFVLGPTASFADREVAYLQACNAACRVNMQRDLERIVQSHGETVLVDGVPHKKHHTGTRSYHSLCGALEVERPTYRVVGVRNGPIVVPLDLEAGIVENTTPALAFALVSGCVEMTDRKCQEQLHVSHRLPPSRSTIERVVKGIGGKAKLKARSIEVGIRNCEEVPIEAHAISVGLDRTTVPMEELRPEGSSPPERRRKRTKPYARAVPDRVDVHYRMAYVGTVSIVDDDAESLVVRRYAISADAGPEDILSRMASDVEHIRKQRPVLPVGITQDGAPEMWNLVRSALASVGVEPSHEVVDRYHFNERISAILRVVEPNSGLRAQERQDWTEAFDTKDETIDRFAEWLATSIEQGRTGYTAQELEVLESNWTYIVRNNDRLKYATIISAGLPQGSGTTEGSCRSLVSVRAKRSGQRWHPEGLDAILTLRSIKLSERLSQFWTRFVREEYTAKVLPIS